MRTILITVPLAVVLLGLLAWSQWRTPPFFVSGFVEADDIRLGSRVGGRVAEVLVDEGVTVESGQVLVRLEPYDLNERIAEARATLAARRATLEKLQAGYRTEEIEQARARRDQLKATFEKLEAGHRPLEIEVLRDNVAFERAELDWAESEYQRIQRLAEEGQASHDELRNATRLLKTTRARFAAAEDELALAVEGTRAEEIAEARAKLAEAEAALKLLTDGFRSEEIAEAQANVEASEAQVAAIEEQLRELEIRAPSDGVVEAIDLEPGDLVAANAPVLTVIEREPLWVRAYVPENRMALTIGQEVSLRVDAFPGRRFKGHIVFVSRQAEFTPANVQTPEDRSKQVFRIKVQIDEGLDVLRPGMFADVFLEPGP